jgi:uncharacterized protein YcbK (DUF882 family)
MAEKEEQIRPPSIVTNSFVSADAAARARRPRICVPIPTRMRHFDPHLFDLLHDLTASLGDSGGEIDVICGYRTPWSNEFLRTRSPHTGVARHSLHMQAEAVDIRLPGIPTSELRDAALRLHRGGVGYYRSSDFVHVDVGRVRHW